jgi:hypothetical protein
MERRSPLDWLMDAKDINWDVLRHPSENIHVCVPTPEKLVDLAARLLTEPMFLPDEQRNAQWVDLLVAAMFAGPQMNWIYEIGDWKGLISFQDIWPGYKAEASFLLWDNGFTPGSKERVGLRGKLCWGADFIRELKDLVELVMREFKLRRLGMASPEKHTVDIATKFLGFKVEGRKKYGFRHDGKTFTQYLLRRIKEG